MAEKQRIPETHRRQVRDRARGHCEYCLLHDEDAYFPHEADHIIAEKHGGPTVAENLAWACLTCNRNKGTDLASLDPINGRLVPLFNPRRQKWTRHFRVDGARIEPLTAVGRVTVFLLRLNDPERVTERRMLMAAGRYPVN